MVSRESAADDAANRQLPTRHNRPLLSRANAEITALPRIADGHKLVTPYLPRFEIVKVPPAYSPA